MPSDKQTHSCCDDVVVTKLWEKEWQEILTDEITKLVAICTYRGKDEQGQDIPVQANLDRIRDIFISQMDDFNKSFNQSEEKPIIQFYEWPQKTSENKDVYRVFRFRAGQAETGKRKVSLICHLDTVPPGNFEWKPFEARKETRIYKGAPTPFLTGRGSIDDKGPAFVAFQSFLRAMNSLRNPNDEKDPAKLLEALEQVTLEVLFDTSEETEMSTPHYFEANRKEIPDLGVVFDAYWSVRAEKGAERPIFSIAPKLHANNSLAPLSITQLSTPEGDPTNKIPDVAVANIQGSTDDLTYFFNNAKGWYRTHQFDDINYHSADIHITRNDIHGKDTVVLTTLVAGAQHGSAPNQNRANGANPVVSLTNYLAALVDRGILVDNHYGEMCRFIRWAFGTRVFGENHPDLLYRFDQVFNEGNGTTYALTKLEDVQNGPINLHLDIRYAIGHHENAWDGSEGNILGQSLFRTKNIFQELVKRYTAVVDKAEIKVSFEGWPDKKGFGPSIRSTLNENLLNVDLAYRAIMGENCPMYATGGATDAHEYPNLVTAGALFTTDFGPPINYHGINEGAPLTDLEDSGKILIYLLKQELNAPEQLKGTQGMVCSHSCLH